MEVINPGSSATGSSKKLSRTLHGTRVVLEESPGIMRLSMPCGGLPLLITGIVWIGLIAWGARALIAGGTSSWILALVSLPGLMAAIVGVFRTGRSISFELGQDKFIARRLGLFALTTMSWNRSEIATFKIRNTSAVVQGSVQGSTGRMYMVRFLVELQYGKEVVLIRQGGGLALGHIAEFLSKALKE
jgi:hypothetical protein